MKSFLLGGIGALVASVVLSNCGTRGGLVAEEEIVPREAHEIKQLKRSEYQSRQEDLGWR